MWAAVSGATSHVTGDPTYMSECSPPPVGEGTLLEGDMRSIEMECYGKLSNMMRDAPGCLNRGLD